MTLSAKDVGLPPEFDEIPHFEFSRDLAKTREESSRTDKVFGIKSFSQISEEAVRRLEAAKSATKTKR